MSSPNRPMLALLALTVTLAAAPDARAERRTTYRQTRRSHHAGPWGFTVDNSWQVHGSSAKRLRSEVKDMTLTGKRGVYGDKKLLETVTPTAEQNDGHGFVAHGVRPKGLPVALGSTAGVKPTGDGYQAKMSDGMVGGGHSKVTIRDTRGGTEVRERGSYSLVDTHFRRKLGLAGLALDVGVRMMSLTPPGMVLTTMAHDLMARTHNRAFDGAGPLVNLDNAAHGHEGAGSKRK